MVIGPPNNYDPDPLRNDGRDIHPSMPTAFHDGEKGRCGSPVGHMCHALGLSIHDRYVVYEKHLQLKSSN